VLLGAFGLRSVVLVDVASFIVAAALLVPIVAPRAVITVGDATSALGRFFDELADGVRLVQRESALATLFAVLAIMTFGGTMLDPLQAPWVHDVLEQGAALYGWLLAVHAVFGIIGTLALGHFGVKLSPRHLIGWTSLLAGALLAVQYNVPSVPLALMLTAAGGVVSVVSAIGVQTLIQQSVRDEYRGRVFGALGASGALFSLLGASMGGVAAEWVGIVPMLDLAATLVAAGGLVVLVVYRQDYQIASSW
jgi:predicted MFS family arabinose efflux permease